MKQYEVKLELFEGPLDLLLYLVSKSEVDIAEISVSEIAGQYLEYLDLMRELNIDLASEYLHMAATLIRLKAQELLPATEAEALAEEEGTIFTREQLIQQLLEHKKYREAARSLRVFEAEQAGTFPRGKVEEIEVSAESDDELVPGEVSVFDLLTAFRRVLQQSREEGPTHVVQTDHVRLDDRIEHILSRVSDTEEIAFEELFADDMRRMVLIVTFMALLELVKMDQLSFRQESTFGSIYVSRQSTQTAERVDVPEGTGGEENGTEGTEEQ